MPTRLALGRWKTVGRRPAAADPDQFFDQTHYRLPIARSLTTEIAEAIVADIKRRDGLLDLRDFAEHAAEWVEPISTNYRGFDLYEMPPSTQGFVALEMLNILEGFEGDIDSHRHRGRLNGWRLQGLPWEQD